MVDHPVAAMIWGAFVGRFGPIPERMCFYQYRVPNYPGSARVFILWKLVNDTMGCSGYSSRLGLYNSSWRSLFTFRLSLQRLLWKLSSRR